MFRVNGLTCISKSFVCVRRSFETVSVARFTDDLQGKDLFYSWNAGELHRHRASLNAAERMMIAKSKG